MSEFEETPEDIEVASVAAGTPELEPEPEPELEVTAPLPEGLDEDEVSFVMSRFGLSRGEAVNRLAPAELQRARRERIQAGATERTEQIRELDIEGLMMTMQANRTAAAQGLPPVYDSVEEAFDAHAQNIGLSPDELRTRLGQAQIPVGPMLTGVVQGRPIGQVIGEAEARGALFTMPEREREIATRGQILEMEARSLLQESPEEAAAKGITEATFQGGVVALEDEDDFSMLGMELDDDQIRRIVSQEGEIGYQIAADQVARLTAERPEIGDWVRELSVKQGGGQGYMRRRLNQMLEEWRTENPSLAGQDAEDQARAQFTETIILELANFRTINWWMAPILVPANYQYIRDHEDIGFMEAMSPQIEIVGLNNNGDAVTRVSGPGAYAFKVVDLLQSGIVGSIAYRGEGSLGQNFTRGMANQRDFLEYSQEVAGPDAHWSSKLAHGIWGTAGLLFTPDAFLGGAIAYKGATNAAEMVRLGRVARRDLRDIDELLRLTRGGDVDELSLDDIAAVQAIDARLMRNSEIAAQMDTLDGAVGHFLGRENPHTGFVTSAEVNEGLDLSRRLPGNLGGQDINLHPTVRKARSRTASADDAAGAAARRGDEGADARRTVDEEPGVQIPDLYDYAGHLRRIKAMREASVGIAMFAPTLDRVIVNPSRLLRNTIAEQTNSVTAGEFMTRLKSSLGDALERPGAPPKGAAPRSASPSWYTDTVADARRTLGIEKSADELIDEAVQAGASVDEINDLRRVLKARDEAMDLIERQVREIAEKAKKLADENPLEGADEALAQAEAAIRSNLESRIASWFLLHQQLQGALIVKGKRLRNPMAASLAEKIKEFTTLTADAELFAGMLQRYMRLKFKDANAIARLFDARAKVWAAENNRTPHDWWASRIEGIKSKEEFFKRFGEGGDGGIAPVRPGGSVADAPPAPDAPPTAAPPRGEVAPTPTPKPDVEAEVVDPPTAPEAVTDAPVMPDAPYWAGDLNTVAGRASNALPAGHRLEGAGDETYRLSDTIDDESREVFDIAVSTGNEEALQRLIDRGDIEVAGQTTWRVLNEQDEVIAEIADGDALDAVEAAVEKLLEDGIMSRPPRDTGSPVRVGPVIMGMSEDAVVAALKDHPNEVSVSFFNGKQVHRATQDNPDLVTIDVDTTKKFIDMTAEEGFVDFHNHPGPGLSWFSGAKQTGGDLDFYRFHDIRDARVILSDGSVLRLEILNGWQDLEVGADILRGVYTGRDVSSAEAQLLNGWEDGIKEFNRLVGNKVIKPARKAVRDVRAEFNAAFPNPTPEQVADGKRQIAEAYFRAASVGLRNSLRDRYGIDVRVSLRSQEGVRYRRLDGGPEELSEGVQSGARAEAGPAEAEVVAASSATAEDFTAVIDQMGSNVKRSFVRRSDDIEAGILARGVDDAPTASRLEFIPPENIGVSTVSRPSFPDSAANKLVDRINSLFDSVAAIKGIDNALVTAGLRGTFDDGMVELVKLPSNDRRIALQTILVHSVRQEMGVGGSAVNESIQRVMPYRSKIRNLVPAEGPQTEVNDFTEFLARAERLAKRPRDANLGEPGLSPTLRREMQQIFSADNLIPIYEDLLRYAPPLTPVGRRPRYVREVKPGGKADPWGDTTGRPTLGPLKTTASAPERAAELKSLADDAVAPLVRLTDEVFSGRGTDLDALSELSGALINNPVIAQFIAALNLPRNLNDWETLTALVGERGVTRFIERTKKRFAENPQPGQITEQLPIINLMLDELTMGSISDAVIDEARQLPMRLEEIRGQVEKATALIQSHIRGGFKRSQISESFVYEIASELDGLRNEVAIISTRLEELVDPMTAQHALILYLATPSTSSKIHGTSSVLAVNNILTAIAEHPDTSLMTRLKEISPELHREASILSQRVSVGTDSLDKYQSVQQLYAVAGDTNQARQQAFQSLLDLALEAMADSPQWAAQQKAQRRSGRWTALGTDELMSLAGATEAMRLLDDVGSTDALLITNLGRPDQPIMLRSQLDPRIDSYAFSELRNIVDGYSPSIMAVRNDLDSASSGLNDLERKLGRDRSRDYNEGLHTVPLGRFIPTTSYRGVADTVFVPVENASTVPINSPSFGLGERVLEELSEAGFAPDTSVGKLIDRLNNDHRIQLSDPTMAILMSRAEDQDLIRIADGADKDQILTQQVNGVPWFHATKGDFDIYDYSLNYSGDSYGNMLGPGLYLAENPEISIRNYTSDSGINLSPTGTQTQLAVVSVKARKVLDIRSNNLAMAEQLERLGLSDISAILDSRLGFDTRRGKIDNVYAKLRTPVLQALTQRMIADDVRNILGTTPRGTKVADIINQRAIEVEDTIALGMLPTQATTDQLQVAISAALSNPETVRAIYSVAGTEVSDLLAQLDQLEAQRKFMSAQVEGLGIRPGTAARSMSGADVFRFLGSRGVDKSRASKLFRDEIIDRLPGRGGSRADVDLADSHIFVFHEDIDPRLTDLLGWMRENPRRPTNQDAVQFAEGILDLARRGELEDATASLSIPTITKVPELLDVERITRQTWESMLFPASNKDSVFTEEFLSRADDIAPSSDARRQLMARFIDSDDVDLVSPAANATDLDRARTTLLRRTKLIEFLKDSNAIYFHRDGFTDVESFRQHVMAELREPALIDYFRRRVAEGTAPAIAHKETVEKVIQQLGRIFESSQDYAGSSSFGRAGRYMLTEVATYVTIRDTKEIYGALPVVAERLLETSREILRRSKFRYPLQQRLMSAGVDGILHHGARDRNVLVLFDPMASALDNAVENLVEKGRVFGERARFKGDELDDIEDAGRASVDFADDGRATIAALEEPDVQSVLRALGHILRRDMSSEDMNSVVRHVNRQLGLKGDEALRHEGNRFVGTTGDIRTQAELDELIGRAEDVFAATFEDFIVRGAAPDSSLRVAGTRIKNLLGNIYASMTRGALKIDIDPEVEVVLERMLAEVPAPTPPFRRVMGALQRTFNIAGPDKPLPAVNGLNYIQEEGRRLGATKAAYEVAGDPPRPTNLIDLTEENLSSIYDSLEEGQVLRVLDNDGNDVPILHDMFPGGKSTFTREELGRLQVRLENERSFALSETLPRPHARSAAHAVKELTPVEALASRLAQPGVKSAIARGVMYTFFGGDPNKPLRLLPPMLRNEINAGGRIVEQAANETLRLISESNQYFDGGMSEVITYLTGGLVKFKFGGRAVMSSGWNSSASVSEMLKDTLTNLLDAHNLEMRGNLLELFERSRIYEYDARVWTETMDQLRRNDPDLYELQREALDRLFRKKGSSFLSDVGNIIGLTGQARPQDYRMMEALMYFSGESKRNGKLISEAFEGADDMWALRTKQLLDDVTTIYGAQGETVAKKLAMIISGHGHTRRAIREWTDMGITVSEDVAGAFKLWRQGEAIPDHLRAEVMATVRRYGYNPFFLDDPLIEAGQHVPLQARKRLSEAVARSLEKVDPRLEMWEKLGNTDRALNELLGSEMSMQTMFGTVFRYMKLRMTRGAVMIRPRYFLMNTIDHFNQMAMTTGFRPAIVSSLRMSSQNLLALPGVNKALGIVELATNSRLNPTEYRFQIEQARKLLQAGGDTVANLAGRMMGIGKYDLRLNDILEGRRGTLKVTDKAGRVKIYSYQDIREIMVQEGIFASFDTSALGKVIRQNATRQWAGVTGKLKSVSQDLLFNTVDDIAEAWAERERAGAVLTLINAGYDPKTACRVTIDALFDYAGTMTKFDRHWLMSMLFPFLAYQKNANRQIFNLMFSPRGAYRMGVIRRANEGVPRLISEVYWSMIVDPYGVNYDVLTDQEQAVYDALRMRIELGYGPIEDLSLAQRERLEQAFGVTDLSELTEEQKQIVERGYGPPSEQPPVVRTALMRLFAGTGTANHTRVMDGRILNMSEFMELYSGYRGLQADRLVEGSGEAEAFRLALKAAIMPRPEAHELPSYYRDRAFFPLPTKLDENTQEYFRLMEQSGYEAPWTGLFLPENTMQGGMNHLAGMAAFYVLGADYLLGISDESEGAEMLTFAMENALDEVVEPERAPILGNVLDAISDEQMQYPRRISNTAAAMLRSNPVLSLIPVLTIEEVRDWYTEDEKSQALMEGIMVTEEMAETGPTVRPQRNYIPPGWMTMIWDNGPMGEFDRLMKLFEQTPLEETQELQGQLQAWARGFVGADIQEITGSRTAILEEPYTLRKRRGEPEAP